MDSAGDPLYRIREGQFQIRIRASVLRVSIHVRRKRLNIFYFRSDILQEIKVCILDILNLEMHKCGRQRVREKASDTERKKVGDKYAHPR